jgi:alpha-N-arabinofuranosidase
MRYRNPVLPGCYPDPSVCRVGDDYYLVTSSFAYYPGVPVFHSRDLVHWRQIGHVLDRPAQLPLAGVHSACGIYAPTLRFHDGLFYMTTTLVPKVGNFIVTAPNPEGPWSDPVPVAQEGIDPSLFFDEDGKVYYTTSHDGAFLSRIDPRTGKVLEGPKVIWPGSGGRYAEAPHIHKRGGWYYLLLAEGGTEHGHMATMARSRTPWGPYEPCPRNPVLTHRSFMSPIQSVGHADLVETGSGEWFAVFLGVRPVGYPPCHHLGRETFLCPVRWSDDGFPVFGNAGRVAEEMEASLAPVPVAEDPPRDDFEGRELAPCWNHLRNPEPGSFSLSERPGFLRLKGNAASLDERASPAWVGRRQAHFDLRASTILEFEPSSEKEEAGLTVFMNERHHYEVFVTMREGQRSAVLRRRIGTLSAETACRALPEPEMRRVVLAVEATPEKYVFLCGPSEGALKPLGEGESKYLSTEVAGGFTGVYLAMYATGNGAPCSRPADFDGFDIRPV